MAWFTHKAPEAESEHPADIWQVCAKCNAYVFKEEWNANLQVCPKCGYHARLGCRERIDLLVDPGTFREFGASIRPGDPLSFSDAKGPYKEKAAAAVEKTGVSEAVLTGSGNLGKTRAVFAVMDFRFLGGSLGGSTGEKILRAAEHAHSFHRPFIMVSASGGARMHEGILSLMQMAKTCAAISRLQKAGCPYVSILTDPTTGGVSASFALIGDINIAEPGALIGFAGRRVIEQTIRQELPPDFQTSEYLQTHGFVDAIVPRKDLRDYLIRFLAYRIRK